MIPACREEIKARGLPTSCGRWVLPEDWLGHAITCRRCLIARQGAYLGLDPKTRDAFKSFWAGYGRWP